MKYEDLRHARHTFSNMGALAQVVVIDTGALITPEADAMLQALHSRSVGGIDKHLLILAKKGASEFMGSFYVGYGHKSIGDCGSVTIFIEGVSMLAAKAIQDYRLYNGQEASTRYIDFSKQPFLSMSSKNTEKLEELRAFYLNGVERMRKELCERHPIQDEEDPKVWEKAINARSFDVMRSFLPAGASTNLAWHTTLRQAADHLLWLRHHPLQEVHNIASAIEDLLHETYPDSFQKKRYESTEQYLQNVAKDYYFTGPVSPDECTLEVNNLDHELLRQYSSLLATRPAKTDMPKFLAECGTTRFSFLLDFGSFRDLQRHRSLAQRMPLLTIRFGFGRWYLEQMPDDLRSEAKSFLTKYEDSLPIGIDDYDWQYVIPMGYQVPVRITGDLPALVYVVELRTGISVHPTLRHRAQEMGSHLQAICGSNLKLYLDDTPDRFNYGRGKQTIEAKGC